MIVQYSKVENDDELREYCIQVQCVFVRGGVAEWFGPQDSNPDIPCSSPALTACWIRCPALNFRDS